MVKHLALGFALLLAGCNSDPMLRSGTWHAEELNERNLRAMLADPAHAEYGVGATGSRADTAAAAVQRLREGKTPILIDPRGSGATASGSQ
ncbi:hypothetical protein [Teichococcus oryzae]|uniref:Uncharacterized protein n=1 Tax=Teichococcus oryzae TaxID=1608942 RepID=A0A5B2TB43_9PROT|nr:hypothetical protein [Pseudoroseomonas oryzae]KAA2211305.1 hypothetical protein F0Q34_20805 [Pseudoroseomonas oryzae]